MVEIGVVRIVYGDVYVFEWYQGCVDLVICSVGVFIECDDYYGVFCDGVVCECVCYEIV